MPQRRARDHRGGQLSAARLARRPRDAVEGRPARADAGDVADPRALPRAGAGRRHRRGHPGHGARRHRHHQRRRDPARELLEPLRDGARRRGRGAARRDHGPLRQSDPRAARGRAHPDGRGPSSCATCSSSAATRIARVKITLPGPFTMAQQARNEFYRDVEELAMDFAAAVNAEARELAGRGRRRHPARRALAPERSRGRQALRGARDQPRARRPHGAHRAPPLLRLRGGGPPPEAHRLLLPAPARREPPRSRSRSRRRSPGSTWACSPISRARRSSSA